MEIVFVMFFFISAFVFLSSYHIYKYFVNRRKEKEAEYDDFCRGLNRNSAGKENIDDMQQSTPMIDVKLKNENNMVENDNSFGTKEALFDSFRRLNILPIEREGELGRYDFSYQGGNFFVDVDDSPFLNFLYAFLGDTDLSDIDEFSLWRKAINNVNIYTQAVFFYSINEEENKAYIHARSRMLFIKAIPDADAYLQSILDGFFTSVRYLQNEIDKLRN